VKCRTKGGMIVDVSELKLTRISNWC
jgi:hypothetical protein